MAQVDLKLLETVKEDLDYLFTEWNKDINDVHLRITSTILRRLLIDGTLGKSAGIFKRQIGIMTPLICEIESQRDFKDVEFYQCGGAEHKGMMIQSAIVIKRALSQEEISKQYQDEKDLYGKNHPVKISVFMKQISFVIKSIKINREEVIKYVCHKLGGAHYDNKRNLDGDASKTSLEYKYALMDNIHNSVMIAEKNAIYYEILSIGRMIINSRDVHKLRKDIQRIITQCKSLRIQMIPKPIKNPKPSIPGEIHT
jgi:hypothetical protein